jgi:hypothetical protein
MKYPIQVNVSINNQDFDAEIIGLKPFRNLNGNLTVYCILKFKHVITDKWLINKYSIKDNMIDTTFSWLDYGITLKDKLQKLEIFKYCYNQVKNNYPYTPFHPSIIYKIK